MKVSPLDRSESEKVKKRSEGQCEVIEVFRHKNEWAEYTVPLRCRRRATQVHHMIGKWRQRGRGPSALAEHKQHVCDRCHLDITGDIGGKKLKRVGDVVPHYTDCYERVK